MLTINHELYEKIEFMGLINRECNGYHMYYNKNTDRFEPYNSAFMPYSNLILTPCEYKMKQAIWKEFYAILTPEEYTIANSFPFKRGFFDYLRETGLIGRYEEAHITVIVRIFQKWLLDNSINI